LKPTATIGPSHEHLEVRNGLGNRSPLRTSSVPSGARIVAVGFNPRHGKPGSFGNVALRASDG